MVPERFAGRDDIYTDDDDAVVVFVMVESLNMRGCCVVSLMA